MTKRTKTVVVTQTAVLQPVTTSDIIDTIIGLVKNSRQHGVEPLAAITIVERDGEYCGAVLCVYAGEADMSRTGKPTIGLSPQFYPPEVATEMQTRGLLLEGHTTRRTGIDTTWCYFNDTLI